MKKIIYHFRLLRKGERRALVIILVLLSAVTSIRIAITNPRHKNADYRKDLFEMAMNQLQDKINTETVHVIANYPEKIENSVPPKKLPLKPFVFDPNTITLDDLLKMNMPEFVAHNLVSYRNAGATFKKPDDLRRIYGLDRNVFEKILPYVQIVSQKQKKVNPDKPSQDILVKHDKECKINTIEINRCDSMELQLVPGIGPVYANRIIKYRAMLGGYYRFNQLWEVYGMDSTRYEAIKKYCTIDTLEILKIQLREASFRELIRHPYIDKNSTYALVQFREYSDSLNKFEDLINNQVLDYELLNRIKPYLQLK